MGMHKELTQVPRKIAIEDLLEQWRMIRDPSKEALRTVPLFAGLDDQELEAIYAIARKRTYPKGSFILLEGDPGDAFYLTLAGEVKIVTQGADGREFILAVLRAGDFFGEMSLFDDQPRSANVVTTEDATFLILYKQHFLNQVKHSPAILFKLLITLCQRLRESDKKLHDLALLDVPHRVCNALVTLGARVGMVRDGGDLIIPKRPTHQDVANWIGSSRETVTRVFNDLEKQGYISLLGRTVVIRKALLDRLSRL
jgi:CRP/FNR family transcriptional regulator, cyclic AMP receptor protein